MEKIHWRKVFNSDYLGSCDIDEGKSISLIIKSVEVRKIKDPQGKEQERNVAIFADGKTKPMILNATNCRIIKKFAKSPFINDWINIPISVYVQGDVKAFGEVTEGLRVSKTQPTMGKPQLTPAATTVWVNAIKYYRENKNFDKIKERYEISAENEKLLIAEASK